MLIRVILLFLLAMLILGMVQKVLRPKRRDTPALDRLRCPTCGRIHASNPPAPCARPDCGIH